MPSVVLLAYTLANVLLNTVGRRISHFHWSLIQLHAAFRRVLEFNEPTSIAAIPTFDKFLVHCEKELHSYPLDKIVRASRGEATFGDLEKAKDKLPEGHGTVSFLKTGTINGRTLGK